MLVTTEYIQAEKSQDEEGDVGRGASTPAARSGEQNITNLLSEAWLKLQNLPPFLVRSPRALPSMLHESWARGRAVGTPRAIAQFEETS
jgi:hypothetical protein